MNKRLELYPRIDLDSQKSREQIAKVEISNVLRDCSIEDDQVTDQMMDRLIQLHELTPTFDDERKAVEYAQRLQAFLQNTKPEFAPTDEQMNAIYGGTFFSDIGKTGPADATPEQSYVVTRIYAIENINPKLTVGEALRVKEPALADKLLADFDSIDDMSADMPLRKFWDAHVKWSYAIIKDSDLSVKAKRAAASHHILEGNFPEDVIDATGKIVGTDEYIGLPEAWVMMLDKYDAQISRAKASHKDAITWLKALETKDTWKNLETKVQDALLQAIEDIDESFKPQEEQSVAAK
ncbi:hypothetical protein HON52_03865 [Candidatus Uhrbacteria bacterium]|jgi:hypothetical protein|nr:hypothetical protein [Candidatus Uhrbacteria bacterium]